ncbi:MAG: acyl-CoA dehydrogenase, partial [Trebonia sp.]
TNIEHKMGLKASTTCELTFGAKHPAIGTLVGGVHAGIRQMFLVIENARMLVGTKAIATLSTGYLNALDYAKNRMQGADLIRQADKTAPRVSITHHPDVRRMLMLQKAYAEGMRSLVLYTATQQDAVQLAEAAGREDNEAAARNELLLPILKGVGSERSYEMLTLSLQTLGGSGFLQDYPIEQYIRDAKIDSLYEGTTGIQSLDLFFRKMVRDQGAAAGALIGEISAFATADDEQGHLKTVRAALADAVTQVQGMFGTLTNFAVASLEQPEELYKVGLNSVRLLYAFGDLIIAWLLARQAEVALRALDNADALAEADRDFYTGKLAAAKFFAATVLPRLESDRKVVEQTTNDLMEIPEGAF